MHNPAWRAILIASVAFCAIVAHAATDAFTDPFTPGNVRVWHVTRDGVAPTSEHAFAAQQDATAKPTVRFGFGCYSCMRWLEAFAELQAATLNSSPEYPVDVLLFLIDLQVPTMDAWRSASETVVASNVSLLFLEPLPSPQDDALEILVNVHARVPHMKVKILANENPPSGNAYPWLSFFLIRADQTGYISGYAAGLLSTSGHVTCSVAAAWEWPARLMRSGFVSGARAACPNCEVSCQHIHSKFDYDPYERGTTQCAEGALSDEFGLHANPRAEAEFADKETMLSHAISMGYDMRNASNAMHRVKIPYAVAQKGALLWAEALDEYLRSGGTAFTSGTLLVSLATGAVTVIGCPSAPVDTFGVFVSGKNLQDTVPCPESNVHPVVHSQILRTVQQLRIGAITTGVTIDHLAWLSELSFPTIQPLTKTVVGGRIAGHISHVWPTPKVSLLGGWKICVFTPDLPNIYTYAFASNSLSNFTSPLTDFAVPRLEGYSVASFGTFTVLFGGSASAVPTPTALEEPARSYVVQHECSGFAEQCSTFATMRRLAGPSVSVPSSRHDSCTVAVAPDLMLMHGGYTHAVSSNFTVRPRQTLSDTWLLNTTSGVWRELRSAPTSRHGHSCSLTWRPVEDLDGGKVHDFPLDGSPSCIVVIGGKRFGAPPAVEEDYAMDSFVFCPAENVWREIADTPSPLDRPCIVAFPALFPFVSVFGGEVGSEQHTTSLPQINLLRPHTFGYRWISLGVNVNGAQDTQSREGTEFLRSVHASSREQMQAVIEELVFIPSGPMECIVVPDRRPSYQRTPGWFDFTISTSLLRVFVFRIDPVSGAASPASITMVTFPLVVCAGEGLDTMAIGAGCQRFGPKAADPMSTDVLAVIVVCGGILVVALMCAAVVVVKSVLARSALAAVRVPPPPSDAIVALAAVSVHALESWQPPSDGSPPPTMASVADTLGGIAQRHGVYEAHRFGNTMMFACETCAQMTAMLLEMYTTVHESAQDGGQASADSSVQPTSPENSSACAAPEGDDAAAADAIHHGAQPLPTTDNVGAHTDAAASDGSSSDRTTAAHNCDPEQRVRLNLRFSLSAALHVGRPRVVTSSQGLGESRMAYYGATVRSLYWLLRQCAVGEVECSYEALTQVKRTLLHRCHMSDLIPLGGGEPPAAVNRVIWRPQVTAQVRRDCIHRNAERTAAEPHPPQTAPPGARGSVLLHERQVAHLFFGELFRILPAKARAKLAQLVLRRLEVPTHKRPPCRIMGRGARSTLTQDVAVIVEALFRQVGPMSSIPVGHHSFRRHPTTSSSEMQHDARAVPSSEDPSPASEDDAGPSAARNPLAPQTAIVN